MHYGDEEQLKKNELVIVVYKHETNKEGKFDYEIASIKKCEYFPPRLLWRIMKKPKKFLRHAFKDKKAECWYETKIITTDGYEYINILSVDDVSDTPNDFDRLH